MKRTMLAVVIEGDGVDPSPTETNRIITDITRQLIGPSRTLPEGVSSLKVCPLNEVMSVLMAQGSPHGFKLEYLALYLIEQLRDKTTKIEHNIDLPSRVATANNRAIINLLGAIRVVQENTMAAFATVGPDQGPLGTPRTEQKAPPARYPDYHNSYSGFDSDGRAED